MSSYTIEECDAAIARRKRLLEAENTSYSMSPADGGTGRSVTRIDRDQLMKELRYFEGVKARLQSGGSSRGKFRVKTACFGGSVSSRREGWETS